jgi:actin-related protein
MYRIFNTMDLLQPVVVDNGSLTIKAGFAATEVPKVILPN